VLLELAAQSSVVGRLGDDLHLGVLAQNLHDAAPDDRMIVNYE
jgi:hypothetical protein